LREREELITRFFAYGDGLEGYRDRPSDFLFAYAKKMNAHFLQYPEAIDAYRTRFLQTMEFVARAFPYGFRRGPTGTATPRTKFEAIAIGSYLAMRTAPQLANQTPPPSVAWLESKEFGAVIGSDGANAIGRLKQRIYFVRDKLLGA